jgi:RNA polymerase sigma factor (sigma-70 family)
VTAQNDEHSSSSKPRGGADELTVQAQQGDVPSFKQLCRGHLDSVYSLCYKITEEADSAANLTTSIFIRIWEDLAEVDGESDFGTWQARTAQNIIADHVRQKKIPRARFQRFSTAEIEALTLETFSVTDPSEKLVLPTQPNRSLWPEIQGHIETENIAPNDRGKDEGGIKWWHIAAAVLFLFVGGISLLVITALSDVTEPADSPLNIEPPVAQAEAVPDPNDKFSQLESEYRQLKAEVLGSVDIDEGDHDTDIQGSMEENLGVVETTISEIVGAMGDDPENQMLQKMLVATYKKQIKLLQKFIGLGD